MASILDRYGIKEVADVTFYKINPDGTPGAPVLFLDTLKVSTIEQTAETAEARGGKGNPVLISWDYGKEINVTIEDALFSPKSMNLMFGSVDSNGDMVWGDVTTILRTVQKANLSDYAAGSEGAGATAKFEIKGSQVDATNVKLYKADGTDATSVDECVYATGEVTTVDNTKSITISGDSFPGTYYITGDTYARSETTGEDQFFQFIIPKAKMQASNTITLSADGDPSTFNMSLKVLRPASGDMMKLVQYDLA